MSTFPFGSSTSKFGSETVSANCPCAARMIPPGSSSATTVATCSRLSLADQTGSKTKARRPLGVSNTCVAVTERVAIARSIAFCTALSVRNGESAGRRTA